MPICPTLQLKPISDVDFASIDNAVMQCAYSVHNKFGRLFDERVYENDLAARLRAKGVDVHTPVPIRVTYNDFTKIYYLDLVANHMLYEIKAVASLISEYDAQCLHYAMLQGIPLAKLVNFGEQKVRGKLLRNSLETADRYQPSFESSGMRTITPSCELLFNYIAAIVRDWGTHLSSHLYNEALIHFFGGETRCIRRLELRSGAMLLGTHKVQCHADGFAFVVTALSRDQSAFGQHLNVLLTHTTLNAIQWINLNHSRVEFTTIEETGGRMRAEE